MPDTSVMGPAVGRLVVKLAKIRIPVIGYPRHERGHIQHVDAHFRRVEVGGQRSTGAGKMDVPEEVSVETKEQVVYRIPETSIVDLQRRFTALQKRADKLGVPKPTFTEVGQETVFLVERDNLFDMAERGYDAGTTFEATVEDLERLKENPYRTGQDGEPRVVGTRTYRLVTVDGEAPKLAGWSFRGTVMHAGEAGNILKTVPGTENIPEIYRTRDAHCDWCGLSRQRRDTFLVENEAGEWKQVGSNCLGDFLGHQSPQAVASWVEMLAGMDSDMRAFEERDYGMAAEDRVHLPRYLAKVAAVIREKGWLARGKARDEGGVATADRAFSAYYPKRREDEVEVTDEDIQAADEALTWVRDLDDSEFADNDFMWNLHVATADDFAPTRAIGIAAAVFIAKKMRDEKELERTERVKTRLDEWFGELKKRQVFRLTVTFTKLVEGYYGTKQMVKFRDQDGREAIWWNSGEWTDLVFENQKTGEQVHQLPEGAAMGPQDWLQVPVDYFQVGETYDVKGTVKAHEVYDKFKQTVLTRVAKEKPK